MKAIIIGFLLLFSIATATLAQNIPAPDIANAAAQIANAPNQAAAQAAQTELLRQQAALLKQQAETLKQQNAVLKQQNAETVSATNSPNKDYMDGSDLRNDCGAVLALQGNFNAGFCLGFIEASTQIAAGLQLFCVPPDGLNLGQMTRVVVKYIDEHPEELQLAAVVLMPKALHKAFPCPAPVTITPDAPKPTSQAAPKPKIDDVDPKTGKPKYANYAEYEDARDAWNRAEAIREFQQMSKKSAQEPQAPAH